MKNRGILIFAIVFLALFTVAGWFIISHAPKSERAESSDAKPIKGGIESAPEETEENAPPPHKTSTPAPITEAHTMPAVNRKVSGAKLHNPTSSDAKSSRRCERRAVVGFRVSWWKKDIAGLQEAYKELKRPKVGRMARLRGTVEPIADSPREPTPTTRSWPKGLQRCG